MRTCEDCACPIVGRTERAVFCATCACERRKATYDRYRRSLKAKITRTMWEALSEKSAERRRRYQDKMRSLRMTLSIRCVFPDCHKHWVRTRYNGGRLYCDRCRRTVTRMLNLESKRRRARVAS